MDALKEGHKMSLSSGKVVALAAGFSVGLTVGYIFYRRISSNAGEDTDKEVCKMTLPVEVYRNLSRSQAKFLEIDDVIGASSELSMSCISLSDAASFSGSVDVPDDELLLDQSDK
ncbi:hypothetical protein FQA47_000640 [Oryzias melastigma]|uniref:Uncharacterized protein n=1 Tax=Oryzias melastigma TaxID=30732 RepID=A0A834FCE6_ORYME|nr:hypothetical protein FQA47_000640 [Oryzias melastigma]